MREEDISGCCGRHAVDPINFLSFLWSSKCLTIYLSIKTQLEQHEPMLNAYLYCKKKPKTNQQKETECFVQDNMFLMDNNVHKV